MTDVTVRRLDDGDGNPIYINPANINVLMPGNGGDHTVIHFVGCTIAVPGNIDAIRIKLGMMVEGTH